MWWTLYWLVKLRTMRVPPRPPLSPSILWWGLAVGRTIRGRVDGSVFVQRTFFEGIVSYSYVCREGHKSVDYNKVAFG